jgi:uncharacterized membrane protein (DUF441 family)
MSFKEFTKALGGNEVEGELLKSVVTSLVVSAFTLVILYFTKLKYVDGFMDKFGFWLFLSVLSIAVVIPAVRQVRAYKNFPCMTGMMIGMTIGMMSGFLLGYYVGATNGMFWGSVYGMAVGIFLGVWNGKCCGVMGTMEGMMAGFMGGLMGAMTAVMMYNDNLKAAGVISFLVCGSILIGLNYMVYKETKGFERQHRDGNMFTIGLSFLLTIITTWLMVYGPRSLLFT